MYLNSIKMTIIHEIFFYYDKDLRPRQDPAILRGLKPNSGKEDLNGIQPMTPLSFSIVPLGMSLVGWQLTTYLAGHFAIQYVDSDIYPIQRAAIVARNLIIGEE